MLKTISGFVLGALIAAAIGAAGAVTGQPPLPGFQAVDGTWLQGLASGENYTYQYGVTAHAGGTQAACLSISATLMMTQVSTVASSGDSICVPFAIAGDILLLANAGANPMSVYAQSGTNLATSSTDTINGSSNSSAYSVTNGTNAICFAPKNGIWNCIKGS